MSKLGVDDLSECWGWAATSGPGGKIFFIIHGVAKVDLQLLIWKIIQ